MLTRRSLSRLAQRASEMRIADHEDATDLDDGSASAEPVASVLALLESTQAGLRAAARVQLQAPATAERHAIFVDVSSMAYWELEKARRALLDASGPGAEHRRHTLDACANAVERVIQICAAVEGELARSTGDASLVARTVQHNALRRARIARVAGEILGEIERWEHRGLAQDMPRLVRMCAAALARMRGDAAFDAMACSQRHQLRTASTRALAWLRAPSDELAGRRLLTDIKSHARLLIREYGS